VTLLRHQAQGVLNDVIFPSSVGSMGGAFQASIIPHWLKVRKTYSAPLATSRAEAGV
jgi:hypothetical protein